MIPKLLPLLIALSAGAGGTRCTSHAVGSDSSSPAATERPKDTRRIRAPESAQQAEDDNLEQRLAACQNEPLTRTRFSIAHRGVPALFPEHTRESYQAAAKMGAGLIECDVTFTRDGVGVCRHGACDLHLTTNILTTDLADRCRIPFSPATATHPANAECCVSDLRATEFKSLCGRLPQSSPAALTAQQYLDTDSDSSSRECATVLTHAESITLLDELGVDFIPELKAPRKHENIPETERRRRALEFLQAYERAHIAPDRVFPQSFDLDTIALWSRDMPRYSRQSVFLDGRYAIPTFRPDDPSTLAPSMEEIRNRGAAFIAPPFWTLLIQEGGHVRATEYVKRAHAADLRIVPWSMERPALLRSHVDQLKAPFSQLLSGGDDDYLVIHQLAQLAGVWGLFSDNPEKVTHYANCFGLHGTSKR